MSNATTTWTKSEIETIDRELYCLRHMHYSDEVIAAHGAKLVVAHLGHIVSVQTESAASFQARKLELQADIDNAAHPYARRSAEDRLKTHARWAKNATALARKYTRLIAKIEAHGLPVQP